MITEQIQAALQGAGETRAVVIDHGALSRVAAVFREQFGHKPVAVVADENTWRVAGQVVQDALRAGGGLVEDPIVFPANPPLYAEIGRVNELVVQLQTGRAIPIAVGSGTVNDITKLASHRVNRPYMSVATAASMDGYTAFGAAITANGFKQTMSCPAPRAVVADLDVLAAAPASMSSSGYGDLLGKVTAGADWILADAMETEPIDERAWHLVQDELRAWTGRPAAVRESEPEAIALLFEGLLMSGLAMQVAQSSRPASGSEHRFSHLWEMQALGHGQPPVPHGFKVGVGTIAAAALYEQILQRNMDALDIAALCAAWPSREEMAHSVQAEFDIPQLAESAVAETLAKYIDADQLRDRLLLLKERWPDLRPKLAAQLLPARRLVELLEAAGCPTRPEEIGVTRKQLAESYRLARTIRSRYTVLDLAYETGLLADCVDALFAPGGVWFTSRPFPAQTPAG